MALQSALDFIQKARADETARQALAELADSATDEMIVEYAQRYGLDFTVEEWHLAFRQDWLGRWMYFTRAAQASPATPAPRE
jgi:hypothetical protein